MGRKSKKGQTEAVKVRRTFGPALGLESYLILDPRCPSYDLEIYTSQCEVEI